MSAYFDIIKLVFFWLTIFVALFQLRLKSVISSSILDITPFILPFYFIVLWLIIGYIIGYINSTRHNDDTKNDRSYVFWFIIGWIIWLIFSAIYYFLIKW